MSYVRKTLLEKIKFQKDKHKLINACIKLYCLWYEKIEVHLKSKIPVNSI